MLRLSLTTIQNVISRQQLLNLGMQVLSAIPKALWKLLFLINFVAGLLLLFPLFYVLLLNEKWFPLAFKLKRFWARWLLHASGVFVSVKGKNNIKKTKKPVVYCSNHVSYLDIVVSYIFIPNFFVFMAKKELQKAPLFNIFFKKMDIPVDRKSRLGSHRAFVQAAQKIDKGVSVFLFPEGTISKDSKLKNFKNGAFKLAIDKQVSVVPITFLNNWKILQNGGFLKSNGRPGISKVIVHEPISTKGMTDTDLVSLRDKVHAIILKDTLEYENR